MQQDVGLDPDGQLPHGNQDLAVALARPHAAKCGGKGFLLLRCGEFRNQQSVANGDLIFQKRLGHRRNQIGQLDPAVNIGLALSGSGGDVGDGVGGFSKLQQGLEAEGFFQRVNVLALQVLHDLGFDGFGVG